MYVCGQGYLSCHLPHTVDELDKERRTLRVGVVLITVTHTLQLESELEIECVTVPHWERLYHGSDMEQHRGERNKMNEEETLRIKDKINS